MSEKNPKANITKYSVKIIEITESKIIAFFIEDLEIKPD